MLNKYRSLLDRRMTVEVECDKKDGERRSKEDTARCQGESMGEGKRGISGWHATVANWIKREV